MPQFRKKPITVTAEQFLVGEPLPFEALQICRQTDLGDWFIETPNGPVEIQDRDWIVQGTTAGDWYPIKDDRFSELYDAID